MKKEKNIKFVGFVQEMFYNVTNEKQILLQTRADVEWTARGIPAALKPEKTVRVLTEFIVEMEQLFCYTIPKSDQWEITHKVKKKHFLQEYRA